VQLGAVIMQEKTLLSMVLECRELDEIKEWLDVYPANYWKDHFRLGVGSEIETGSVGDGSKESILINSVIPFLFFYGKEKKQDEFCEKAVSWLEKLKAEDNRMIRKWKFVGIMPESAADSQGLLHLEKSYCSQKRCLDCMIGRKVIGM
jgi:hypothetical protein